MWWSPLRRLQFFFGNRSDSPNALLARAYDTHSKALCAGEAKPAVAKALEQGRLADAFCLICGVLRHYKPLSPHISLDAWGGQGMLRLRQRYGSRRRLLMLGLWL